MRAHVPQVEGIVKRHNRHGANALLRPIPPSQHAPRPASLKPDRSPSRMQAGDRRAALLRRGHWAAIGDHNLILAIAFGLIGRVIGKIEQGAYVLRAVEGV